MAHSAEEEAARDFICFSQADAVIVVCDADVYKRQASALSDADGLPLTHCFLGAYIVCRPDDIIIPHRLRDTDALPDTPKGQENSLSICQ